ncbi:GntR family transcriptional regulator [Streptomyces sp. NPDC006274]|uniref:GntR family transcriptional regulator n=1 Tax=unclassified Streptomyces TaxID=2593676 RepID=UPI0033A1C2C1
MISRIASGVHPMGRAVPGADRLRQEFGIARGTARKTLVLLAEEGYARTVVGKGSFVIERATEGPSTSGPAASD